ncbi:hypothetical protein ABBQ32_011746 [Trebouxia sp. C0010 RCD-2024]
MSCRLILHESSHSVTVQVGRQLDETVTDAADMSHGTTALGRHKLSERDSQRTQQIASFQWRTVAHHLMAWLVPASAPAIQWVLLTLMAAAVQMHAIPVPMGKGRLFQAVGQVLQRSMHASPQTMWASATRLAM